MTCLVLGTDNCLTHEDTVHSRFPAYSSDWALAQFSQYIRFHSSLFFASVIRPNPTEAVQLKAPGSLWLNFRMLVANAPFIS